MDNTEVIIDKELRRIPMVPLRGLVVFPTMVTNFDVARDFSVAAFEQVMKGDRYLFLVTQKSMSNDRPKMSDLYDVGTIVKVRYLLRHPNRVIGVMVEGVKPARLVDFALTGKYYSARVDEFDMNTLDEERAEAYRRTLLDAAEDFADVSGRLSGEVLFTMREQRKLSDLGYNLAINVLQKLDEKQDILSTEDLAKRTEKLINYIDSEKNLSVIENELEQKTRQRIDGYQKEGYLREKMRTIQDELSDDGETGEIEEFRKKINALPIKDADRDKVLRELDKLAMMNPSSPDYNVSRSYIEWIVSLPFGCYTEDNLDIGEAEKILERDHYGLKKVKERILEFLAVRSLTKGNQGSIICFAGPPGVGKTSISKSIAESLGRKFVRMSLGGVHDEAEIRGHRRTYIGAIPGRIISGIKEAGTMNPVFLLDEIDKMASDFRGDPASAMLEVLDPTTNTTFNDHYLDIDFDLSDVIFLTTANDVNMIPRPLYDRMEIINVDSYTEYEKFEIAKRHLIPKELEAHGLKPTNVRIEDEAIKKIISGYTYESGVRELDRRIATVMRKAARSIMQGKKRMVVKAGNLEKYLGKESFRDTALPTEDSVGVVTGLAWTSGGGTTLPVETAIIKGNGAIELTGQLGDVMKESAKIGFSYLKANREKYGISPEKLEESSIHIHAPEGAVPKDGPSAGITMCLAMLSAFTGRKVRHNVAMTGEITLSGRVLPIGGLNEKSMAALRAGITTVIIPEANKRDLDDMPEEVRAQIRFIPVRTFDEVVANALGD